jgi:hypothetical protein
MDILSKLKPTRTCMPMLGVKEDLRLDYIIFELDSG